MENRVPCITFKTADFPPARQWDEWRAQLGPVMTVRRLSHEPTGFYGAIENYLFGAMTVAKITYDPHFFQRDEAAALADGYNHIQLNLHVDGGYPTRFGDEELLISPGDITLHDFSKPIDGYAHQRVENVIVGMPRDVLERMMPIDDLHGLRLGGESAVAQVLGDHMRSLLAWMPHMLQEEAGAVLHGTAALVAACFYPTIASRRLPQTVKQVPLIDRMKTFVEDNLTNPALSADLLADRFNLSRSTLFRLFKPYGGVQMFIRNRRLTHAMAALMSPSELHRRISEVAHDWGFENESTFSRQFRQHFSMSPVQVRQLVRVGRGEARGGGRPGEASEVVFREWMLALRRR